MHFRSLQKRLWHKNIMPKVRLKVSDQTFWDTFYGLPSNQPTAVNIFLIGLVVILVIAAVVITLLILNNPEEIFVDRDEFYNLEELIRLDRTDVECCVFPGQAAPNEEYVYDTATGITYSREQPININTVCSTFGDQQACIDANTDDEGNIIPAGAFKAQPYYTWEQGLFVGCDSTTACT